MMKILFDHSSPFVLGHGGFQIQIEQTKRALESLGVEVEFLRWWDVAQTGDLIHFFGVAPVDYIEQAHWKSLKIVQTALFTETCNRGDLRLKVQGAMTQALMRLPLANGVKRQLTWGSFRRCDMNIVGLEAERRVLEWVYDVHSDNMSVLPLGLPQEFLAATPAQSRGDALICVGTVTERKNTVRLARMAHKAEVPILFVGKAYYKGDPYWAEFAGLIDNRWVRHHSHVENSAELINLYRSARGFVIMSRYENWCLAAHEAAACGLPLLLPKQNWSLERFGLEASYFFGKDMGTSIAELKTFYEHCSTAPSPRVKLHLWTDVAQQLRGIYERVLSTSR